MKIMSSDIVFQSKINWKKARVIIMDMDLLREIPPENIKRYLIKLGWEQTGSMRFDSEWQYNNDFKSTLIVPASQDLVDYDSRVYVIINALESKLNKCQIEIFEELIACDKD